VAPFLGSLARLQDLIEALQKIVEPAYKIAEALGISESDLLSWLKRIAARPSSPTQAG